MEQIMANSWADSSGRIKNPRKDVFLKLAKLSIDRVNRQRDENGMSYARKAIIIFGIALNTNRAWEEKQLSPVLKTIIIKHRMHF